jgi:hypothetical protein
MRTILALALAAALAGCGPSGSGNETANRAASAPSGPEPAVTITLASSPGADCSAKWDGAAVAQEAITERSFALLDQTIRSVGGVEQLTLDNMPVIRVEAPAAMAYACVGATLRSLQRSGFASAVLRPAGGDGQDAHAEFFLDTAPSPGPALANMTVGRGALTWNGTRSNLGGIRDNLQIMAHGVEEPPPGQDATSFDQIPRDIVSPRASYIVTVARDASFGEVHALLRTVDNAGQTATLRSCAGPAGAQGDAIPGC